VYLVAFMNRNSLHTSLFLLLALALGLSSAIAFQTTHREILRTKEKELSAVIDVSFGNVYLERGTKEKIVVIDYENDAEEKDRFQISYDMRGSEGMLRIRLKKTSRMWGDDESDDGHRRTLKLRFTDDIPIAFDLELGAGRGDFNLTGLQVKDLKISTGASSVEMRCDIPNPISADNIRIESGVSKFTATNLCYTNFRKLKFSGGVGAYRLDFGGDLHQDASAKIEVGLGSVSVSVPKSMATRLLYDASFFSSFDLDDDFSKVKSGTYETDNFVPSQNKLTIQIESGLGSVKVRRK
jgi:hypothetical protein